MAIYIFTAIISSWIIWIDERISDRNTNLKKWLLFFAILIPAIVAGMRASNIGTDVRTYIAPLQYFANSSDHYNEYINFNGYLYNGQLFSRFEKGYVSLIYLCSRFDKSLFLTFFVSELLILASLIGGLYEFDKINHLSICLGFFIFFTFFYNLSFNLARQCIAMFILLFGFNFLVRKEWIKYICIVLIAMLFHTSAAIGIIFLLIYWFLYDNGGKTSLNLGNFRLSNNDFKVLCITIISLIIIFLPSLLKNIFSSSAAFAIYTNYIPDTINLSFQQLAIKLPFLIIILIEWRSMRENPLRYFYLSIAIIDIFLSQFSGQSASASASEFGSRISWYTSIFYIYSVPNALMSDKIKNRRLLLTIFLVLFLIVYWIIFTVILNYNETFPYAFSNNYFR